MYLYLLKIALILWMQEQGLSRHLMWTESNLHKNRFLNLQFLLQEDRLYRQFTICKM